MKDINKQIIDNINNDKGFIFNNNFKVVKLTNEEAIVECKLDEKASDVIEKYRNKSGDSDPEKRFYFDSKRINPNLTLEGLRLLYELNTNV